MGAVRDHRLGDGVDPGVWHEALELAPVACWTLDVSDLRLAAVRLAAGGDLHARLAVAPGLVREAFALACVVTANRAATERAGRAEDIDWLFARWPLLQQGLAPLLCSLAGGEARGESLAELGDGRTVRLNWAPSASDDRLLHLAALDITVRETALLRARDAEQRLALVLGGGEQDLYLYDAALRLVWAYRASLGKQEFYLAGSGLDETGPLTQTRQVTALLVRARDGEGVVGETVTLVRGGRERTLELRLEPAAGGGVLVAARDTTARLERERSLREAAEHDPLTGLHNRRWLTERLRRVARGARRSGQPAALVALALEGLRGYGDLHGPQAAERLLVEFATGLDTRARRGDDVARLSLEHFALVCPATDLEEAGALAARLRRELARVTFPAPGGARVTLGVVAAAVEVGTGPSRRVAQIIADAQLALAAAREGGGLAVGAEVVARQRARLTTGARTAQRLRDALTQGQLVADAHPVLDLRRRRVAFHEMRFTLESAREAKEGGWAALRAAAWRAGLEAALDYYALTHTLAALATGTQRLALQIFVDSLGADWLLGALAQAHAGGELGFARLLLAARTDRQPRSPAAVRAGAHGARELGVRVGAIEPRGGWRPPGDGFRADAVVLGAPLTRALCDNAGARAALAAAVAGARTLDQRVIAQGVDDERTLAIALGLGVTHGQGVAIGPPAGLDPAATDGAA